MASSKAAQLPLGEETAPVSPFTAAAAALTQQRPLAPEGTVQNSTGSSAGSSTDSSTATTVRNTYFGSDRSSSSSPGSATSSVGGSPAASLGFTPLRLSPDDWLVYLRIQKTGSQTFWSTLQKEFKGEVRIRH